MVSWCRGALLEQRVFADVTGLKTEVIRPGVHWLNGAKLFVDMPSLASAEQVVEASRGTGRVCVACVRTRRKRKYDCVCRV